MKIKKLEGGQSNNDVPADDDNLTSAIERLGTDDRRACTYLRMSPSRRYYAGSSEQKHERGSKENRCTKNDLLPQREPLYQ
mmetsp:Transcript_21037/g.35707  ORF Transcript_21037/g.35707 Transcript_21037/m.35707 type:complete len:81 (-) Transcript_21037:186-428(-)